MSCDRTLQEAKASIKICHDLQEQLPPQSEAREEMFRLLSIMKSRKPRFSAGGFFDVNRHTIFSVLYVATTYFIIIIQLRQ